MINKIKNLQDQLKHLLFVLIGMLKTSLSKSMYLPLNENANDTADLLNQVQSIYSKFWNEGKEVSNKMRKIR